MGALWTASLTWVLLGAPLMPQHTVQPAAVSPTSEADLPPAHHRLHDPRDGRFITYGSTCVCGLITCTGCTCIPVGLAIPVVFVAAQSITVLLASLVIGGVVALGGLALALGGAGGYAGVLVVLHNQGLWDTDAAAQACNDVLYFFSFCWSIF